MPRDPKPKTSAGPKTSARRPKTFSLHWGSGVVEEEVQIETEHHLPTLQLLKFTDGEARGARQIRFCYYDQRGRFQRSPLVIDAKDLRRLKTALKGAPELRKLLARLAD